MRNRIVILTFPAHFYLTKLCLDSIRKHFQCCKNILILVDDTSELAWDSYYTDCKNLYLSEFVETQAISKINELNFLNLLSILFRRRKKYLIQKRIGHTGVVTS